MAKYIISDLHLGHKNVLSSRKFNSIEEHDEKIKENWCSVVKPEDKVYVLGDVTMHKAKHLDTVDFKNWPGRKILIMGNHDESNIIPYFNEVYGAKETYSPLHRYSIVLTHIPIALQELKIRWDYNIHGHMHFDKITCNHYINVCAEHINYTPQLIDDLIENHIAKVGM